jgi:cytoskeletal protein CcmA (bactofilin family)
VNPYLAVAALIFLIGVMFLLPLVPAWIELRSKSDAVPLNVVQQNAGEIRHFANGFRSYIGALEPIMQYCVNSGGMDAGALSNGEDYVVLGRTDEIQMRALAEQDAVHPVLIMAAVDVVIPTDAKFSKDIYAAGQFQSGERGNFRAILGELNVHLGKANSVLRWVHSVGEFTADLGCRLYGRISSDLLIRLHADCNFMRMNAPRIEIGAAEAEPGSITPANSQAPTLLRFIHDGDFEVHAGEIVASNMVIRGTLHIHSGARVCGSVKVLKDVLIDEGVAVEGSLIGGRRMRIGPHCTIHGPVIAEHELVIDGGTRCGTEECPTTVSAPHIEVEEGVVVFGTLWAREHGHVAARA